MNERIAMYLMKRALDTGPAVAGLLGGGVGGLAGEGVNRVLGLTDRKARLLAILAGALTHGGVSAYAAGQDRTRPSPLQSLVRGRED